MSEPEKSRVTIEQRDHDEDATFIATKYEASTAVSIDGPVPMVIDQIVISPSDYSGEINTDCGVSLNYTRTSEYDTHLGAHIVLQPDEEARLVEWLHTHKANFKIETTDSMSKELEAAAVRGRCENCGEYFDGETEWEVTLHVEDNYDRHFCTTECFKEATEG